MPAFVARRSIVLAALLVGASATANGLQAQRLAPVGAHADSAHAAARAGSAERQSTAVGDALQAPIATGRSRRFHVVMGLLGGTAIGVAAGSVAGARNAARCHSESCQGPLGGVGEVLEGGLIGAVVGLVVGAAWPVRT